MTAAVVPRMASHRAWFAACSKRIPAPTLRMTEVMIAQRTARTSSICPVLCSYEPVIATMRKASTPRGRSP